MEILVFGPKVDVREGHRTAVRRYGSVRNIQHVLDTPFRHLKKCAAFTLVLTCISSRETGGRVDAHVLHLFQRPDS